MKRICNCGQFLTLKINDEDRMVKFCKNCEEEYAIENSTVKVSGERKKNYDSLILEMKSDDVTFPRVKHQCKFCKNDELKYAQDSDTMTFIFVCGECGASWQ